MPVSRKHILQQGPVLGAIGRTMVTAIRQQLDKSSIPTAALSTPGPVFEQTFAPRPPGLIRDYVRHVGGDPSLYKRTVPPHLFPQWTFPVAFKTIASAPYPLAKTLNGGCKIEINSPIPQGEPLTVAARLESIDDNGRRAVMHQRIVTSTPSAPEALVSHMYAIVPLPRKAGEQRQKKEKPRIPTDARELARYRLSGDAGLDYAVLTGDFNPIHWIPAAAHAQGFRNTILHGFATMARAYEGIVHSVFAGKTDAITMMDVQFTRPLVLPAKVGLYCNDKDIYVGDALGGPAYMQGRFERR